MMDALRAITFSGACCGFSQYLMQQRRAVRATVREERDGAAGDEEPATKSRASSVPTGKDERSGRRCKRNGPEGVESSTVDRQQSPENLGPARPQYTEWVRLGPFGPNLALLPVDILPGFDFGKFESWPNWPFFGPFT